MQKQLTRIDTVKEKLDILLKSLNDEELKRNGYVHLYGVGQTASLLALKRGMGRKTAELAAISGMLHDYTKFFAYDTEDHAHLSEPYVRLLLEQTGKFEEDEINKICQGVYNHSDKSAVDSPFDEVIKDADLLQNYLINPMEDMWAKNKRVQNIIKELGL